MTLHDAEFVGNFFGVEVDGVKIATFTACSGISIEFKVIEHAHATATGKKITTKIPGAITYSEVVLKRGLTPGTELSDWFKSVVDAAAVVPRKTGAIVVYDREFKPVAKFNLTNMWPSKFSVGDLSAGSDEVMIEEVTLQHELIEWAK
jgi:phage tail-like protein